MFKSLTISVHRSLVPVTPGGKVPPNAAAIVAALPVCYAQTQILLYENSQGYLNKMEQKHNTGVTPFKGSQTPTCVYGPVQERKLNKIFFIIKKIIY